MKKKIIQAIEKHGRLNYAELREIIAPDGYVLFDRALVQGLRSGEILIDAGDYIPSKTATVRAPTCPVCGAPEKWRERRPDGNSECMDGHRYKSVNAVYEES